MECQLGYVVNFKWHMPICAEVCRADSAAKQKYMLFFETVSDIKSQFLLSAL